ncbi:MAG: oxidoreductase [Methylobacteriaceae bacterium]|nr:oxidoreductase [Methylobacteriaceae bacterium]
MPQILNWSDARLVRTRDVAPDVREFEIAPVGAPWKAFAPGSHINISVLIDDLPDHRSYSLVGSGDATYKIAVKRAEKSRGGSRYMWSLQEGARLKITEPRNHFSLDFGKPDYLLVAGGIGITPIVSMAAALRQAGHKYRLIFANRERTSVPFHDELSAAHGGKLDLFITEEGRRIAVADEIDRLAPDGQLYLCGPMRLIEAAKAAWKASGRPATDLRFETFGTTGHHAPEPFVVRIPRLGKEIGVAANETMLHALVKAGIDVMSDCERGECGLCAIDVIACDTEIDHRDVFFNEDERRANTKICACVSRAIGGSITIETAYRPG